ncbi:MAG: phosphatidylglycerophosphatase A [Rhodospirillum sp.]|nr:phosphatidylglycerophosphatase A [Rhodospirillum sp.]MCF8491329.1 phosphatidylglycerophosphatase A [Rhodospirillum sp.]MCF8503143.1 phosphatidylglycerophosphatase A [Rhodospirillum sp.]
MTSLTNLVESDRDHPPHKRVPLSILAITTWFGAGHFPIAPGTVGSIAALPFAWALTWTFGPIGLATGAALAFLIGTMASSAHVRRSGESDPRRIVIDEVAGQWLTLVPAPLDPMAYLVGLACFRLCDITKPWPACLADRRVHGGVGIMLDDGIAAVYSTAMMAAYVYFVM